MAFSSYYKCDGNLIYTRLDQCNKNIFKTTGEVINARRYYVDFRRAGS